MSIKKPKKIAILHKMLAPRIGNSFLKPINKASNGFILLLSVNALNATYIPPIKDILKITDINERKKIGNELELKYSVISSIFPPSRRVKAEPK